MTKHSQILSKTSSLLLKV